MTTEDFIIELFCRIDDQMKDVPRHSQAGLYPSELVTIGVRFALKGVRPRLLSLAKPGLWSLVSTVARTHPIVPAVEKSASMDVP